MGLILSFSGRSGTGKSSAIRSLLELYPEWSLVESISTRTIRASDLPGEIRQVSPNEFEAKRTQGDFAWFVQPHSKGTWYGTELRALENAQVRRDPSCIIITPEIIPVFDAVVIAPRLMFYFESPPESVLYERMYQRGDPPKDILGRLETSRHWDELVVGLKVPIVTIPPLPKDETNRFILARIREQLNRM